MQIRAGDLDDAPAVIGMFDEAVEWMVARGNTKQWGTEPFSARPDRMAGVRVIIREGQLWVAEEDGEPVGALIVSDHPMSYVEPVDEPELYVSLLLVSRRHAGKRIGARLLDFARERARQSGVSLLRVDCYAGGTGDLVRYYERNGFTATERLTVGDWPGQLLEQRV
jgi:GNAT superfamily N-acetyltransferase